MAEVNECKHDGKLTPIGQNAVVGVGEVAVIISTLCDQCNEVLIMTQNIKLETAPPSPIQPTVLRIPDIKGKK